MKLIAFDCALKTRHGRDAFQTYWYPEDLEAGCGECGDRNPDEMYFVNLDSSPWCGCGKCAINHYSISPGQMICVCDICSGYEEEKI